MSERPTDPLELYAWLKQQIATLDAELDSLKESVFSSVDATGGIFEKDKLKALKKTEIDDGIATIESYSEFVTIKFKKPDAD
jgi:hypothetical protein